MAIAELTIDDIPESALTNPTIAGGVTQLKDAWCDFEPRPNRPEVYDEQAAFVDCDTEGIAWLIAGNGAGSTECAMRKIAQLVLKKFEAPRKDTPFWIIGNNFEQIIKVAWVEKLCPDGHGHIPDSEIDYERIIWYRSKRNLPFEVPLFPWPIERGGDPSKNWILCFKSYEQGRKSMQAEAIGGFCFVEQFPWDILTEVLRGCREYNFPGSMFCEFTPVDPGLSMEIEEMEANGHQPEDPADVVADRMYLPKGWEIFHANTEIALEAGHCQQWWFDQFFGMVPVEMRETRTRGAYATYEGAIYQSFNPSIHLVGDDVMFPRGGEFPLNVYHRRGIDWGSGSENAFVCLWVYKNGVGQYFVYDEYYSTNQQFTTVDHLCEVLDRNLIWGWDDTDPHFGMTYADPSGLDGIRTASQMARYSPKDEIRQEDGTLEWVPRHSNIAIRQANNRVLEGIEHVQWLLKPDPSLQSGQPRLMIHKDNCPFLSRQMRSYRWLRSGVNSRNPQDARREPLKKDDHATDAARYVLYSDSRLVGATIDSMSKKRERPGIQLSREGGRR